VRRHGICIVPATGGEVRQITKFGSQPVWSPDGQRIAFAGASVLTGLLPAAIRRGSEIWMVAADGSGLRRAIQAPPDTGEIHSFCWWSDGKRLLLTYRNALYLGDAASGKIEPLADTPVNGYATPAPDGQSVYYTNDKRIFRLPLSGDRKPVQLFDGDNTTPALLSVSHAGNRLTFSRDATHSELWQAQPGADPQPIFRDVSVRVLAPKFSPDGTKLAFLTSRYGSNWEIWLANPDGSGAFALTAALGLSGLGWNADGSAILYFASRSELRRVSLSGVNELLLKISFPFGSGQIAPDERSVIYTKADKSTNIWKLTFGSQPRQLTFEKEYAGFPAISADGKWIVCDVKRSGADYAMVMDIDGGQQRLLTPQGGADYAYSFSNDDRHIAVAAKQNDVWNIATIDRVTGERKVLTHYTDFGAYVRYPAWRPHTEQLVYEKTSVAGNIYSIDIR
jgi:Tol biopolymer transport system component